MILRFGSQLCLEVFLFGKGFGAVLIYRKDPVILKCERLSYKLKCSARMRIAMEREGAEATRRRRESPRADSLFR